MKKKKKKKKEQKKKGEKGEEREVRRSAGLLAADCAVRRDENARTIKPNDPLFRPRIIPARASCHEELRQAETNEGPPSHPLYSRKGKIISRVLPPT